MNPPSSDLARAREDASALARNRQWRAIVELVAPLSDDQLLAEPELALLYADACRRTGDTRRALGVAERLEPVARRGMDRRFLLDLINVVGMSLFETGQLPRAEERFTEILGYATEWGDQEWSARASNNLGVIANVRGQRDLALTYYQRALAAYQTLGDLRGLAQTHHNLGISYRDLNFDREADAHYLRAIGFAQAASREEVIALAETERAMLRARWGDGSFAAVLARRAIERFEQLGNPLGRAEALRVLAAAARASGRDDVAAAHLEEALGVARTHTDPLLHAEVQRDRGLLLRDTGQPEKARTALREAAEHFASLGAVAEAEAVRAIERVIPPPSA